MPVSSFEDGDVAIYAPENLQRLASILWNRREEPAAHSVLMYVVLGAFAGLRPVEAVALEWKQIDWAKKEIRLNAAVAKSARSVPMKENLLAFLLPDKGRNGLLVIHKKVANLLRTECAQAGVRHISNGLRRSYACHRLAESSEETVRTEMGLDASHPHEWKAAALPQSAKYWAVRP